MGPGHGFAGNVLALSLDGGPARRRAAGRAESGAAVATATALASRENGLAQLDSGRWAIPLEQRGVIRVQWCHGAPGMVTSLAGIAADDEEFGELLRAGGELHVAGGAARPRARGSATARPATAARSSPCTRRFGDALWLERARAVRRARPWLRPRRAANDTAAAATRSGRATSAPRLRAPVHRRPRGRSLAALVLGSRAVRGRRTGRRSCT